MQLELYVTLHVELQTMLGKRQKGVLRHNGECAC